MHLGQRFYQQNTLHRDFRRKKGQTRILSVISMALNVESAITDSHTRVPGPQYSNRHQEGVCVCFLLEFPSVSILLEICS